MSGYDAHCYFRVGTYCSDCPHRAGCREYLKAHKPEPNESPSSPRNRGSLTAPFGQNEVKGTASQLARSLPAGRNEQSAGGDGRCHNCGKKHISERMQSRCNWKHR
jgi:hypothetical protein